MYISICYNFISKHAIMLIIQVWGTFSLCFRAKGPTTCSLCFYDDNLIKLGFLGVSKRIGRRFLLFGKKCE